MPASGAQGATALLNNVLVVNGQLQLQVGSFLTADVAVGVNTTAGVATISFTSVQLNTGDFLNNAVKDLQNFTLPLQNLANSLTQPLVQQSWASSLTAINLLKLYDPTDGQALQDFNMRSSSADEAIRLIPPREMTLEKAIEFIADDEFVEVTPKSIRLRKKVLDAKRRPKRWQEIKASAEAAS